MPAPRTLPPLDRKGLAEELAQKWAKDIKAGGGSVGDVEVSILGSRACVKIEHNLGMMVPAADIDLAKHKNINHVCTEEYGGHYDWHAGVYLKDHSLIYFDFIN